MKKKIHSWINKTYFINPNSIPIIKSNPLDRGRNLAHYFASRYIKQTNPLNGDWAILWSRHIFPILNMGRRVDRLDITCSSHAPSFHWMSYAMLLRNLLLGIYYMKGSSAMNCSAVQQTYRSKGKRPQSKLTLHSQWTFLRNIRPFF